MSAIISRTEQKSEGSQNNSDWSINNFAQLNSQPYEIQTKVETRNRREVEEVNFKGSSRYFNYFGLFGLLNICTGFCTFHRSENILKMERDRRAKLGEDIREKI